MKPESQAKDWSSFSGFYAGKRVLVTGHTGFKGSWLCLWLKKLGAEVWGVSLPAPTNPNLHEIVRAHVFTREFECDIRDCVKLDDAFKAAAPDVVFHLAAQPLVRKSYSSPVETFSTNAVGCMNVLESIRKMGRRCVTVVVTSDKCYENKEWEFSYRENDPLGGHDVYSMSKAAAELVAHSWNKSFFLPNADLGPMATARAGNVIGGGDYAEDRIVPDCVRSLMSGQAIRVRRPGAIRPWQHVLESLSGYLWLASRLAREPKTSPTASPFNFGPQISSRQSVRNLVERVLTVWPGEWIDCSNPSDPHEASLLSLSIEKAASLLGWEPVWDFNEAVDRSISWYRNRHVLHNPDMLAYSTSEILSYTSAARARRVAWT